LITIEHHITIDKPVEEVWKFLTDFENIPRWDIGVRETRKTSSGPAGLGTTFQNAGPFLGHDAVREYKVTEYEPNKKVRVELTTPSSIIKKAGVSYSVTPAGNGTLLTFVGSLELSTLFRLIQPILSRRAARDGEGDLENLKRLIEAGSRSA
jgi:uncharacterized protein YndB with AHSA1/START domain